MDSYLELIVGPMFSGKTSKLLDIYKQCKFCNMRVIIVNHEIDKRYHDTMVSSHDKVLAPCIQSAHLSDIKDDLIAKYDVILINEGQFFGDLYSVVLELLQNKKKIYICGLDGDFSRKKFGCILDLIPMCDKITKLSSLCSKCKDGTAGIFSMRLTDSKDQTMVGSDSYIPVCRKCYEA
jgi:thymidine kinase